MQCGTLTPPSHPALQEPARDAETHEGREDLGLRESGPAEFGVETLCLGKEDGCQAGEPVDTAREESRAQGRLGGAGAGRPPRVVQGREAQNDREGYGLRVVESLKLLSVREQRGMGDKIVRQQGEPFYYLA